MSTDSELIRLANLRKRYNIGQPTEIEVLHGLDMTIKAGEFTALIGPSGSGKSTLLNILGLLESPTEGAYELQGHDVAKLADDALTELRLQTLGFIFQFHHLLPAFSALENVLIPTRVANRTDKYAALREARELLDAVGLKHAEHKKPAQLSGGMQQRVAIARALCLNPRLVLADEPSGNLDSHTADEVFALLRKLNQERGTAFLIVTHDPRLAARCDRIIELTDGAISNDRRNALVS